MIDIRVIINADDPALGGVVPLFEDMYAGMALQGLFTRLVPGGAQLWSEGIAKGLERFGRLVVAEEGGVVKGFAHATMKLAPEHLGGARVGQVTHVHVDPSFRTQGVGKRLVSSLDAWFQEKQIATVELQVVIGNEVAIQFWKDQGYGIELVQMRKG
jgi:ribosomal protein S18 acetylase RimI-like enzyme